MKKKVISFVVLLCVCLGAANFANAATSKFSGSLDHRLLNGSDNNAFHKVIAKKKLTMSGTVNCKSCISGNAKVNPTYVECFDANTSGKGTPICKTTVNVGIYETENFSASGYPKTSKCFLYIFKVEDDGYNLWIEGTLKQ